MCVCFPTSLCACGHLGIGRGGGGQTDRQSVRQAEKQAWSDFLGIEGARRKKLVFARHSCSNREDFFPCVNLSTLFAQHSMQGEVEPKSVIFYFTISVDPCMWQPSTTYPTHVRSFVGTCSSSAARAAAGGWSSWMGSFLSSQGTDRHIYSTACLSALTALPTACMKRTVAEICTAGRLLLRLDLRR
jgi:hypothetical protein